MNFHLKRFAISGKAQPGTFSGEFRDKARIIHHCIAEKG